MVVVLEETLVLVLVLERGLDSDPPLQPTEPAKGGRRFAVRPMIDSCICVYLHFDGHARLASKAILLTLANALPS